MSESAISVWPNALGAAILSGEAINIVGDVIDSYEMGKTCDETSELDEATVVPGVDVIGWVKLDEDTNIFDVTGVYGEVISKPGMLDFRSKFDDVMLMSGQVIETICDEPDDVMAKPAFSF